MAYHRHGLPAELYDEIISYLWNDIPSLKACAFASRSMTIPSQRRLFYCVALRAPLEDLNDDDEMPYNGLCGTSYNFRQLLRRSPHIANYIMSLHILDPYVDNQSLTVPSPGTDEEVDDGLQYVGYKLENGEDVLLDSPTFGAMLRTFGWLQNDKSFPLCAPLLHNLKALVVTSSIPWRRLSNRVVITLLNLMQLSSLHYLHINFLSSPHFITQAIGENVKHLVLHGNNAQPYPLRIPHPPLASFALDSLSMSASQLSSGFLEISRMKISGLRKLVINPVASHSDYITISSLLRLCGVTLEDLEIVASIFLIWDHVIHVNDGLKVIDFRELTALKRFSAGFFVAKYGITTISHFSWLNKILRSFDSTPTSQQLENIAIRICYYDQNAPEDATFKIMSSAVTFDALLEDEFTSLRKVEILIDCPRSYPQGLVDMAVEVLNDCPAIAMLRSSRSNLVVDIRAYTYSFRFGPPADVRWETYKWDRWK